MGETDLTGRKTIAYETLQVEYPDVKSTLENHVTANAQAPAYSIPTIICPDGTYIVDSRKIADYIERQIPIPSLHLDSPYLEKVEHLWSQYMKAITPIFIPLVPKRILNAESIGYWYTSRPGLIGMPLDQLEREKGGVRAWNEAGPVLREVTVLLKENEGPFLLGQDCQLRRSCMG
ncbi:Glutathione S-transferase N-terminal [Penicillium soppii]|uniref:Glutathione S-transferase N-terminal n=1 Tax=Penicillium soppii TaxID=69789 RepID=UPI00254690E1|nr:Glutathione S-transferase N-terminal [Penicillium soppii]KAJ5856519.1 Glutathione S-transferase N-terminal [Penicillium soppii]